MPLCCGISMVPSIGSATPVVIVIDDAATHATWTCLSCQFDWEGPDPDRAIRAAFGRSKPPRSLSKPGDPLGEAGQWYREIHD